MAIKEPPTKSVAVPVAPRTTEVQLTGDSVAGILLNVEESLSKLVLEKLDPSRKGVDSHISADFETLILHSVEKVVSSLKFITKFLNTVMDSSGFISQVVALFKSQK